MLKPRQLETLANLKTAGLETPEQVIAYCKMKLKLPCKQAVQTSKDRKRKRRSHSRQYYREIISFLEGKNE